MTNSDFYLDLIDDGYKILPSDNNIIILRKKLNKFYKLSYPSLQLIIYRDKVNINKVNKIYLSIIDSIIEGTQRLLYSSNKYYARVNISLHFNDYVYDPITFKRMMPFLIIKITF